MSSVKVKGINQNASVANCTVLRNNELLIAHSKLFFSVSADLLFEYKFAFLNNYHRDILGC